jgi:hypothetical protein
MASMASALGAGVAATVAASIATALKRMEVTFILGVL